MLCNKNDYLNQGFTLIVFTKYNLNKRKCSWYKLCQQKKNYFKYMYIVPLVESGQ